MIKGCTKRVIVVKDIQSGFFEEAFFIVKPDSTKRAGGDSEYISEANKIVKNCLPKNGVRITASSDILPVTARKNHLALIRDAIMFIFGFLAATGMFSLIYY